MTFFSTGRLMLGAAVVALGFTSCKDSDSNDAAPTVQVALVHLSPTSSSQDAAINGKVEVPGMAYRTTSNSAASPYLTVSKGSGAWDLQFRNSGTATANATAAPTWEGGKKYTACFYDTGARRAILLMEDDGSTVAAGKARVRFVHAVLGIVNPLTGDNLPVDITFNGTPRISNVSYGTVSSYIEIDAGTDTLGAQISGIGQALPANLPFAFASGKAYTIYGCGIANRPIGDPQGFFTIFTMNN